MKATGLRVLIIVCLALLGAGAWFILGSVDNRLAFAADDVFYVTIPAHMLLEQGFPSLDGVYASNGFHLSIFYIDVLLTALGIDNVYVVNQWLNMGLLVVAGALMYRLARRYLSADIALVLAAGFMVFPHMVSSALTGLETILFSCALILFYTAFIDLLEAAENGQTIPYSQALGVGLLGLLAYLARAEFLFHAVGLVCGGVVYAGLHLQRGTITLSRETTRRFTGIALLILVPVFAGFLLYGVFGLVYTGQFFQSSASQKTALSAILAGTWSPLSIGRFLAAFARHGLFPLCLVVLPGLFSMRRRDWTRPTFVYFTVIVLSIVGLYVLLVPIFQRHYTGTYFTLAFIWLVLILRDNPLQLTAQIRGLVLSLLPVALILGFLAVTTNIMNRGFGQAFIFLDAALLLTYAVIWLMLLIARQPRWMHVMALCGASIVATASMFSMGASYRPVHVTRAEAAACLKTHMPADTLYAAEAAGIYGHILDYNVMNLDGAISWPALEARNAGRLPVFIVEAGVDVLLDYPDHTQYTRINDRVQIRSDRSDLIASDRLQRLQTCFDEHLTIGTHFVF